MSKKKTLDSKGPRQRRNYSLREDTLDSLDWLQTQFRSSSETDTISIAVNGAQTLSEKLLNNEPITRQDLERLFGSRFAENVRQNAPKKREPEI